jgi:glutaminyl-tRNA synthetase
LVVLDPLKVEITTYKGSETIEGLPDFPPEQTNTEGLANFTRSVTMSNEVFIDRSDFVENPPEGYFRLGKNGSEVKLRYSYCIKLEEIVKDKKGNVTMLKCSHDPETRDIIPDRKPKVVQWVDAKNCDDCEVRLINKLFNPLPEEMPPGKQCIDYFNAESLVTHKAKAEKALAKCEQSHRYQFERCGYFAPDYACFEEPKRLVFNRVVPLKESSGKKILEGTGNSRKEEQAKQAAEKTRLSKISPKDYFKSEFAKDFSAYDENGSPTHDAEGTALTKNKIKTLKKDLEKHEKVYKAANP